MTAQTSEQNPKTVVKLLPKPHEQAACGQAVFVHQVHKDLLSLSWLTSPATLLNDR